MNLHRSQLLLIAGMILINIISVSADVETNPDIPDSISYEPHPYLEITSDDQLRSVAESEGWEGDGSSEQPFIIDKYRFNSGELDPQTAVDIKDEMVYEGDEFHRFSLIITNIESYIIIRYNQFVDAVLINTNGINNVSVVIEANIWVSASNPNNLISFGDGFTVRHNTFFGSNHNCESNTYFTRYLAQGVQTLIEENIFEIDDGCSPLQNLLLRPFGWIPGLDKVNSYYTIKGNYFKSSDFAINTYAGGDIFNNDFDVGRIGIITNGKITSIKNNNFYVSNIGLIGGHNYNRSNGYDFIDNGVEINAGDIQHDPTVENNYYDDWTKPDKDGDSIVDEPYYHCSSAVYKPLSVYDLYPSVKPHPTYFHPIDGEQTIPLLPIVISVIIGISLSFISLGYVRPYLNQRKISFHGKLVGPTKNVVKELFQSQSILYYSLIGQSKIGDKEIENEIKKAIPRSIYDYKFLLHPIRLTMIKLLYENLEMSSVELKDVMEISWNDYLNHSGVLKKKGYIRIEDGFVDGNKRAILTIEPRGVEEFKALSDLLQLLLDNSSDLTAYIKIAQERLEQNDPDMYPSA